MSTLIDYIKWRGDLEFWQDGFNVFDNLVFSAISYVEMDQVFNNSEVDTLFLTEVSDQYFEKYAAGIVYRDNSVLRECPNIMKAAASAKRYQKVLVRNYVSKIDTAKTLQFSAVEFLLPDGTSYVAYRGTDDTIIGWKEDFLLAVSEVEAEKLSVEYLDKIGLESNRRLRIGGHSKGGHLAVYGAAKCSKDIQDRILDVYSNDGPGFSKEFVKSKQVKAISDRVLRIIPEESVVGMLMEPVGSTIVVKSTNKFIMQHDLMSWEMDAMEFVTEKSVTSGAKAIDKAIKEWLDEFEDDKRIDFVEDVFAVLEASEAQTLSGIQEGGIKAVQKMTKRLNELSGDTREQIGKVLKLIMEQLVTTR